MPFQVSRSAWSVIGWVTISPPKINSEISKILALNFRDVQNFNKVPGTPKFQDSQKFQSFPYVLEKSRPLGLGIFEILEIFRIFGIFEISEILDFWKFQNFQKVSPYVLEKSLPLGLGIWKFWNFGIFGVFGVFGNLGNFELVGNCGILGIDFQEG